jgi:hypothetical protein
MLPMTGRNALRQEKLILREPLAHPILFEEK